MHPVTRPLLLSAVALLAGAATAFGQAPLPASTSSLWKDVDERTMMAARSAVVAATGAVAPGRDIVPLTYRTVQVDAKALRDQLEQAPREFTVPESVYSLELDVPLPYGKFARFRVQESPIMEEGLAKKYPGIKTYVGQGIDDPTATMRMDVTPRGFHAIVLSARGQYFIDPYWSDNDGTYISYYKRNFYAPEKQLNCAVTSAEFNPKDISTRAPVAERPTGASLRIYRLALAATAEYTAAVSGVTPGTVPQALAAMVTSVNRCSAVYERDLAIRFVLVSNTDQLVFTDPTTDGYTNSNGSTMLGENQAKIDSVIGSANYDIGHVFSTGGGGVAGLGVVCRLGQKARGVTGSSNPVGDPYDIDYVVHEMGHQFGANHPFNGTTGSCAGGNRNASTAYEPGSGTTIMGYAGICSPQDLAPHSDDYFHTVNYSEIDTYTSTGAGAGCPTSVVTGNNPPVIAALSNFTIPSQTPFALTASATDADGDPVSYCWEEFDLGAAQDPTAAPRDNGASPIFRSYDPSPNPTRLFPSLTYILNNSNLPPALVGSFASGEFLPSTSRTMTFRVTARDNRANGGGSNYASMTVTSVAAAGPFVVSSHNAPGTIAGGSSQNVTWSVASTDVGPISCANVKISLSTDGGNTFPFVLAASAANNGSATVIIPSTANVATTQGRIKVEAVGNIFFDISDANLTITSSNLAPTLNVTGSVTVARGTPTPTAAVVGTAADANGDALSVSVSDLPGDVSVTPSIAGANISLSVLANCTIVTTLTTRTYPITLTVTDSKGSTTSGTVNLVITPNPAPTIGTYADTIIANTGTSANVNPSAAPADVNNNLIVNPVSVQPATLPGGGTITVNANTGAVTVTTTAGSTPGMTPVRVTVLDTCGASAVRIFNITVVSPNPLLTAGTAGAPSTESCLPPNGAVDPGETVTLSLPILNTGGGATSNLVATLQSSGGVTPVGNPAQNYGAIAAVNGTASRSFQFVASGVCGGTITATLQLQDGATNFGNITYTITLGAVQMNTATIENFDGVAPPALPAGWSSTVVTGGASGATDWTTEAATPDTAPNAGFATPIASISDVRLDSATVAVPAGMNQLSFKHRWDFESGFDGGVLEISINGAAFSDIVTAGGSFVFGGYNVTISTGFSSPIAGRSAWSGNFNASYTTTLINLPAGSAGQNVKFRFRLATDSSVTPSGAVWRIDTIQLITSGRVCTSCSLAPSFTNGLPPSPVTVGTPYMHTFTATGNPVPTFAVTGGTLPSGLTLTTGGVLAGTPTSAGNGSFPNITVTASNGVAPAATQNFGLNAVTLSTNYIASFGLTGPNALLTADPRGNGLANLLEYALGLNPSSASLLGIPVAQLKFYAGVPYVYITFPRSSVATDLTYVVEASADLQTWTQIASSSGGAVTSGPGFVGETGSAPTFTVEVRDTQPVDPITGPKRFLRLRVTTP